VIVFRVPGRARAEKADQACVMFAAWPYAPIAQQPAAPGWFSACGSSLAAPMFAGITRIADQLAGDPPSRPRPALQDRNTGRPSHVHHGPHRSGPPPVSLICPARPAALKTARLAHSRKAVSHDR
jgi:hypothetical protein